MLGNCKNCTRICAVLKSESESAAYATLAARGAIITNVKGETFRGDKIVECTQCGCCYYFSLEAIPPRNN